MPSMPGGDDKKEDDKAPETPEAKAEREQQVKIIFDLFQYFHLYLKPFGCITLCLPGEDESSTGKGGAASEAFQSLNCLQVPNFEHKISHNRFGV